MKKLVILVSGIIFINGCLEIGNQNPKDIFSDREKFPAEIEKRANPQPNWSVGQYESQGQSDNLIRVAVVDSGVDYNNPNLFYQIDFSKNASQFSGAGRDFMGNDDWAHPNLIQTDFYAFMAESIENKKIKGAPEDAINAFFRINSDLVSSLETEIKQNPLLSNSIFAKKINAKSVNFLIARFFVKNEYGKEFKKELYAKLKEKNELINLENTKPGQKNEDILIKNWSFGSDVSDSEWITYFSRIEHADLMHPVIVKVYNLIDEKYKIEKRLLQLANFTNVNSSDEYKFEKLLDNLNLQMGLLTSQFQIDSPMRKFLKSYCSLISANYRLNPDLSAADGSVKSEQVISLKNKFFTDLELYLIELKKIQSSDPDKVISIDLVLKNLPKLRARFEPLMNQFGPQIFNCSRASLSIRDLNHEKIERSKAHPLYNSSSPDSSHGTHVAGIISRQSPRIKIVPIRVVTQGIATSSEKDKILKDQFVNEFSKWIFQPVIKESFLNRLTAVANGSSQEAVKNLANQFIEENFSDLKLNLAFFEEIQAAVRYIGENKIKIANLSLGLNYEAPVAPTNNLTTKERIKREMNFLMMEYFKYSVASQIDKYANQTLFVIASGNDGKWLDGKSRSGLPCDLSSSELKKTAEGKSIVNNRLKNILCVGSINPNDEVSSFSNIPLTDVPFVFGYGESILSTVQVDNCEGNNQDLEGELGFTEEDLRISFEINGGKELVEKIGWTKKDTPYDFNSRISDLLRIDSNIIQGMYKIIATESCAQRPKHFSKMTGTSMATPAVAGYIARRLVAASKTQNLSEEQIYTSYEYSPQNIIKYLREKNPIFGGESLIQSVTKVVKFKTWDNVIRQRSAGNTDQANSVIKNINDAPLFDMNEIKRQPNSKISSLIEPELQKTFWPKFKVKTPPLKK